MVKKVSENSKPLKITSKKFCPNGRIYGQKFLQAIFNSENFEFSNPVLTIRFLRLWRIFPAREQKFSEIFYNNNRIRENT